MLYEATVRQWRRELPAHIVKRSGRGRSAVRAFLTLGAVAVIPVFVERQRSNIAPSGIPTGGLISCVCSSSALAS
jgi:hypothetical protein